MSTNHTPGPWKGDRIDGMVKYSITGANGDLVLAVQHKSFEFGFIGPNAPGDELLVLAAPDLLKACVEAKKHLVADLVEPGRTVFWNLVNAISKAEGRA